MESIVASIGAAVGTAAILWLVRAVFTLQRLIERETKPNGGESTKDYMRKTRDAIDHQTTAIRAQTNTLEEMRHEMQEQRREMSEHNRLTNELVGSLLRAAR